MSADSKRAPPAGGTLIDGKYRVERLLGEGGMGMVLQAMHVRLGQRVAIKVLHPGMRAKPEIVERFEREARAAARLRSPHAVRVIDVDVTPEHLPYMVMELLDGHDLAVELSARGRFAVPDAVACVLQACRAMSEAHGLGIVHRDLKPANLFLAREGTSTVVKVLDFGISKMAATEADVHVTSTLATMGTPLYMSPEQIRSAKAVDARADVWSLGVILFELLAGRPPFVGTAMAVSAAIVVDPAPLLRELRPDVPEALELVVQRALSKAPEARWPDVQSFAAALAPFGADRVSIQPAGAPRAPSSPSLVTGPTLAAGDAAAPAGPPISPVARTTPAAVGTTPPPIVTSDSWAAQPAPAPALRRGRVGLRVALAGVALLLAGVGVLLRTSSPPVASPVTALPGAPQAVPVPSTNAAAAPADPAAVATPSPEAGAGVVPGTAAAASAKPPPSPRAAAVPAGPAATHAASQLPPPPAPPPANPVRL